VSAAFHPERIQDEFLKAIRCDSILPLLSHPLPQGPDYGVVGMSFAPQDSAMPIIPVKMSMCESFKLEPQQLSQALPEHLYIGKLRQCPSPSRRVASYPVDIWHRRVATGEG
jgi:hypothetical protein